jgi:two-component system, NtrC family, nitrogen regulation response regulator NtrX
MTHKPHILVVDDEPDIRALLKEILEDEGYEVSVAENGHTARNLRQQIMPDVVLLDIWMPDIDGISLLKEWHENKVIACPVIMISGHGNIETAVEATRLGAYDFIEKPLSISKLLITIARALEMVDLQRENYGLRKHVQMVMEPIGHSEVMKQLREQIKKINQHNTSVLITGESGTGRTLFARYIHHTSLRAHGPFVNVRMAGINPDNQALELFGQHGSNNMSRLEQANGGTLFIKDIVDMNEEVQARLLNSLENQACELENSEAATFVATDVRIIAATAYDPEQMIINKRLREDLYYHLNVVSLHLPPLREHCEDIPELLDFYVNIFATQEGLPYRRFSVAAQNRLRNYNWPGNIRELRNLIQRVLILGDSHHVELEEIEPVLNTQHKPIVSGVPIYDLPLREAREQFERDYLEHQLQEFSGNVSKVAVRVGLERTHLYRKLRALDIDPKQIKK